MMMVMANILSPSWEPGSILNTVPTHHNGAVKGHYCLCSYRGEKKNDTQNLKNKRLRKEKLQEVNIFQTHILPGNTKQQECCFAKKQNKTKNNYFLSHLKKNDQLSFMSSDFKFLSDVPTSGGPPGGTVPPSSRHTVFAINRKVGELFLK